MLDDTAPETAEPVGLSVAQMTETTGISGHTLRYYERAGLIQPITRTPGGQRRYQPGDIEWVRFLRRLRETGMPIAQMRHYADLRAHGDTTIPERMVLLVEHQQQVRRQIARLRAHDRALTDTIADYQHVAAADAGAR